MQYIENAAGRIVPTQVNGRETLPYQGVGKFLPQGRKAAPPIRSCAQYAPDGNKVAPSLIEALRRAGLRDGMTISSHHHFRDGDLLMSQVFASAKVLGVRDLVWYPTAVFPCHAPLLAYLDAGTIHHVEGSLHAAFGRYASLGKMRGAAVLRSHGSRYRSIQDGDTRIDIAIIAAPAADAFGNCSGVGGRAACGPLGFALADSQYADHVIAVTDTLVPFPCVPWHIQGNYVDQVVVVDQVGDPAKIVSGTTQITKSPDQLLIAESAAQFVRDAGIMRQGFSFQAGAGGISLAFTIFLGAMMRATNTKARFIRGGSVRPLVELLNEGLTDYILDGQSFDLDGVRSLRDHPAHIATSPFTSYSYHGKGNFASLLDCIVLGATEVDVDFNANVVTHSDGYLLHGIGGWQDGLFARCTILTLPTFRDRIPVIRERVTTLCGPGELIDVIVTERGIAINPRRQDLLDALSGSKLPVRSIHDLKAEVEAICGGAPQSARVGDQTIGVVTWVDGTIIDSIKRVA
ncbi:MAG: citrate lyase subunit alpha [Chloroflexi bacterium]|nr:citrate lyase subunit alpha [Chloroflexota bacterium]